VSGVLNLGKLALFSILYRHGEVWKTKTDKSITSTTAQLYIIFQRAYINFDQYEIGFVFSIYSIIEFAMSYRKQRQLPYGINLYFQITYGY
jgi:hypothetical protein